MTHTLLPYTDEDCHRRGMPEEAEDGEATKIDLFLYKPTFPVNGNEEGTTPLDCAFARSHSRC